MPTVHFLNVRQGDCSIVQHGSGRVTMIDVNNARRVSQGEMRKEAALQELAATKGNFNQKAYPANPIVYMQERGISGIFRFVLSHPDMDHMDGITDIFDQFSPPNFWDTDNTCDKDADDWDSSPYRKEDWDFYRSLRDSQSDPKRLVYHSGEPRKNYWDKDGIHVLAPTQELVKDANEKEEWNDASQVILYRANHPGDEPTWKTIFGGDSHDGTWDHILDAHRDAVSDVDLLIAPHHGRDSDRDFAFLDVLNPKLTLFGNASSKHLAYDAWSRRGLRIITNNQAGSVIVDLSTTCGSVYCTNRKFAESTLGDGTSYHEVYKAWLCDFVR
jgi:beta-lactamase superfamily II metal-dependent hydrolase